MYKMLNGIRGVRLKNRKVLRAPGPRTKCFERLFCRSINCIKINCYSIKDRYSNPGV